MKDLLMWLKSGTAAIGYRFEILFLFDCLMGNPNGDPDFGNLPRTIPDTGHGFVTDVAIKRRLRNYVSLRKAGKTPYQILLMMNTCTNRLIAKAHEDSHGTVPAKATKQEERAAGDRMCQDYWDVRTFGGVLNTGAKAGQIRGPVQVVSARSLDPVSIQEITITRMTDTKGSPDPKKVKTPKDQGFSSAQWQEYEDGAEAAALRTMGTKAIIPYGLFAANITVSAFVAEQTGFSAEDLALMIEGLENMYDHDRTSSKGLMTCRGIYIFKHVGTADDPEERAQQAKLGCAPAHKLLDNGRIVTVVKKDGVEAPMSFDDYTVTVDESKLPEGVEFRAIQ